MNLIGYSYGALIAAQIAHSYTHITNNDIDHLVLLAAPIESKSLDVLRANIKIKSIIIINLTEYGDPVFAGMSDIEVVLSSPLLSRQMTKSIGHFYYASMDSIGMERRRKFASHLYNVGLR
jgi:pimeloyl-ACP methyl ester carboxylesterase